MRRMVLLLSLVSLLCGCTPMRAKLGTLKNPYPVMVQPVRVADKVNPGRQPENPFVAANYMILMTAVKTDTTTGLPALRTGKVDTATMRQYLDAGFALSDIYCAHYFRDAEESRRRRQFGRSITNDTGTAISTILSLANAGQNIVGGSAAFFGLADKTWRSYDDAFVVAPDLSQVRELVVNAQDVFRKRTMEDAAGQDAFPTNYAKAQSVIQRYAEICSTLGMRALLNSATADKTLELQSKIKAPAAPVTAGQSNGAGKDTPASGTTGKSIGDDPAKGPAGTSEHPNAPQGIPLPIPG